MHYHAFISRDPDGRCRARFVDFPDWDVIADSVDELGEVARARVEEHVLSGSRFLPQPTQSAALPRLADGADGYWMGFDLGEAMARCGASVMW